MSTTTTDTTNQTVTLPSGDQITPREALELGRSLIEAFDLNYNNEPRTCSPSGADLTTACTPLSVATVVIPATWDTFTETRHAIYSAANSGAIPTHMHEGRLHCMEADVIAWWRVSRAS